MCFPMWHGHLARGGSRAGRRNYTRTDRKISAAPDCFHWSRHGQTPPWAVFIAFSVPPPTAPHPHKAVRSLHDRETEIAWNDLQIGLQAGSALLNIPVLVTQRQPPAVSNFVLRVSDFLKLGCGKAPHCPHWLLRNSIFVCMIAEKFTHRLSSTHTLRS